MHILMKYSNGSLEVSIESSQEETYSYKLDDAINLTSLVVNISESKTRIKVDPDDLEAFKRTYTCDTKEMLKVAEYIYKIIEGFNDAFSEVYPESTNEQELTTSASASGA